MWPGGSLHTDLLVLVASSMGDSTIVVIKVFISIYYIYIYILYYFIVTTSNILVPKRR